jgi:hypothetical protein
MSSRLVVQMFTSTHTGWAVRRTDFGQYDLVSQNGMFILSKKEGQTTDRQ